jgi:hypothetical protein
MRNVKSRQEETIGEQNGGGLTEAKWRVRAAWVRKTRSDMIATALLLRFLFAAAATALVAAATNGCYHT